MDGSSFFSVKSVEFEVSPYSFPLDKALMRFLYLSVLLGQAKREELRGQENRTCFRDLAKTLSQQDCSEKYPKHVRCLHLIRT